MIDVFSAVKGFLHTKRLCIDHWVFRLHYRFTVLMLICFCIVVSTKQYAGDPIKCSVNGQDYSGIVDSYCLVTTTYTVRHAYNLTIQDGAPHPGILSTQDRTSYRYHTYYQWVGFLLFLQAVSFYFPHWLWKNLEGGRVKWLLDNTDTRFSSAAEKLQRREFIVDCLRARWGRNTLYVLQYSLCELLCLANVIFQMVLLDMLFEGDFLTYGTKVINYYYCLNCKSQILCPYCVFPPLNPFTVMFPKVTSCSFSFFGETGKIRSTSVLCVLPVNIINEKIYLFLWFWFIVLIAVTAFAIVFKSVTFPFRVLRLGLLRTRFRTIFQDDLMAIVKMGNLGDWFFIHLLGQNMDEMYFSSVVSSFLARSKEIKTA